LSGALALVALRTIDDPAKRVGWGIEGREDKDKD
jgi:hypothetical protein